MGVLQLKDSHPTARKEHKCMLCGDTIKKGEKYHRQTLIYDDKPYDWIEDVDCEKATYLVCERIRFMGYDEEDGLSEEGFQCEIFEILTDDLGIDRNDAINMTLHEQVMKVLEHYDEIHNGIVEATRQEFENYKQREYYKTLKK